MKKVLSLVLATLLVLTSVAAVAEALPSKTVTDVAQVTETVAENGEVALVVEAENAKLDEVVAAVLNAVNTAVQPVTLYTADTQAAIAAKVGEAELELNELVALTAPEYTNDKGAVTAKFAFPTLYTTEQTLVAVLSLYTADAVEEVVLDAAANEDGTVAVTFTTEVMEKIAAADDAVLAILNTK